MTKKQYSTFHIKFLDWSIRFFSFLSKTLVLGSFTFAEMQTAYSTASADWAVYLKGILDII